MIVATYRFLTECALGSAKNKKNKEQLDLAEDRTRGLFGIYCENTCKRNVIAATPLNRMLLMI